jgi:hypothetical protein
VLRYPTPVEPKPGASEDGAFYYVDVWNQGARTAEDVVSYIAVDHPDWRNAGLMRLLVLLRPAYPIYLVDSINGDKTDTDRFALAVIEKTKTDKMDLSGKGLPETFALIIAVKKSEGFRLPTAGPLPAFIGYECKFKIELYFKIKDTPYTHAQTYEIDATQRGKITVTPKYAQ